MSKRKKLLNKIKQNPKCVRFAEIDLLLKNFGFVLRKRRHFNYIRGEFRLTIAFNRPYLKEYIMNEVIEVIEKIETEEGEE